MDDASPYLAPRVIDRVRLICDSFERLLGRPLASELPPGGTEQTRFIADAPFVVVSHNGDEDPLFDFGNLQALRLWEMPWSEFVGLPSRYSAEPGHREERERLLREVQEKGFSENYSGVRTSKNGRRFTIERATVFNLDDDAGKAAGQAALFADWTFL